ncbi:MAG TPA: glycosyltransferase 87 family protein [Intrasporangium sp.]|nr:glycosyltransferase 87 family protein [Intrasporangium sp.]
MTDRGDHPSYDDRVHPTWDDPVVTAVSEGIGGPVGEHAGPHRWWTPVRVVLACTAVFFALGMLQKVPCYQDSWLDNDERYTQMCYSDLPYLYVGRGFAELTWPYSGDDQVRARYPEVMEYPVGISYFAWGAAWVTHVVAGAPDIVDRAEVPVGDLYADDQVVDELRLYVAVSAVLLGAAALVAAYLLAGVNRNRPWDAVLFALSPALLLNGLVNWDLLAVALVAGALWAWSRDRPVLTGVLIGLGTATKLYPLFLLGGLLVICLRRRAYADLGRATGAAALVWVLANAPAWLSGRDEWQVFWTFNADRGPDLGSLWLVFQQAGHAAGADQVNLTSWVFFAVWCLGVLVLGLHAPETPRLAQIGFLVVAGFLLVNKVYSPQYVLWLLPLAVIARPRWRDLLVWQAGELLYFAAVWWYLGGHLAPAAGDQPGFYWMAIFVRIACQLYLVAVVARDVVRPEYDPVEREWRRTPQPVASAGP